LPPEPEPSRDAWPMGTPTAPIAAVSSLRSDAIGSIDIVFNEVVSGFILPDLTLAGSGSGSLLAGQSLNVTERPEAAGAGRPRPIKRAPDRNPKRQRGTPRAPARRRQRRVFQPPQRRAKNPSRRPPTWPSPRRAVLAWRLADASGYDDCWRHPKFAGTVTVSSRCERDGELWFGQGEGKCRAFPVEARRGSCRFFPGVVVYHVAGAGTASSAAFEDGAYTATRSSAQAAGDPVGPLPSPASPIQTTILGVAGGCCC
jgi:hypothetical protein